MWGVVIFSFGYGASGLIIALNSEPKQMESTSDMTLVATPIPTAVPTPVPLSVMNVLQYSERERMHQKVLGTTSVFVTGDVLLARTVNAKMVELGDFEYPFGQTADDLKKADIAFVNLETPLTPDCKIKVDGMVFCGNERAVEGLVRSGVDVVNFANNHAGNQGGAGVVSTIEILRKAGIAVVGVGEAVIVERNGKKFGFLGFDDVPPRTSGISWADPDEIKKQIWELRPKVDFVIVQFHWGQEYVNRANAQQRLIAHAAVDAGADLVVGNHPHWVQGVELYKEKFIAYSHGNFVFDQQWSKETTEGVVGKYIFDDKKLSGVEYYPVILDKTLQTRWATQSESESVLKRMVDGSK